MAHWSRDEPRSRRFTFIALIFLILALVGVLAFGAEDSFPLDPAPPTLLAFAHAMPHQGWAPLTVHLSPFGSQDLAGAIARYEWDLDGDGAFETDATATRGYTQVTYTKARTYLPTLRVTNEQGQYKTAVTSVTLRHPASSNVDYWTIFDDTRVGEITLFFTEANWTRMMADPTAKLRVEGDIEIFGERLEQVSIGPRGNFTLNIAGKKVPWQIDSDDFITGQEIHNLKQLLLTNNIADPAVIGEKIVYDLLELAGVPASHVGFVEVYVDIVDNSEPPLYWGLYTLVERVDNKYIGNRFGRDATGGKLYKTNHYRRGAGDLVYYGPMLDYYPQPHGVPIYDLRTDDAPQDYSDLIQFLWILDGQTYDTPESWSESVEAVFDMDIFLRWLAVETAIMSWDIYPFTGNNYYLYHNPATEVWEWLPWDQTWGGDIAQPLFTLPSNAPRLLERAPLYDNLFTVPRYRQTFAAYLDLLTRVAFNETAMAARAQAYRDLIAPSIYKGDPAYTLEGAMYSTEEFENAWQQLINLTRDRSHFIRQYLEGYPETYTWIP
jgi:hypothetical protein